MRKIIFLFLCIAIHIDTLAKEKLGQEGHGGDAVTCFNNPGDVDRVRAVLLENKKHNDWNLRKDPLSGIQPSTFDVQLLDLYEMRNASIFNNQNLVIVSPETDPRKLVRERLRLFKSKLLYPGFAVEEDFEQFMRSTGFQSSVGGVTEVDDSFHQFGLPENCLLLQMATQNEGKLVVESRLYKRLTVVDQAALLLHEAFQKRKSQLFDSCNSKRKDDCEESQSFSIVLRGLVGLYFSSQVESMNPMELGIETKRILRPEAAELEVRVPVSIDWEIQLPILSSFTDRASEADIIYSQSQINKQPYWHPYIGFDEDVPAYLAMLDQDVSYKGMTLVSGMSPLLAPKDRRPSSHYFRSTGALGFDSSSRLKTATTRNAEIIPGFRYSKLMFTIFLPSGDVQKVSHAGYSSNSSKEVDVLRIRGIACILPTHHDIVREKAFAHDSLPSTISSSVVFHNQRSLRYCVTAKTSPSTYKNFKIKPLTPFQVSAKGDIEILVLAEKTMIPGRKEPCMPGQLLTSEDGAFSCSNDSRYSTNQSTYETENILN